MHNFTEGAGRSHWQRVDDICDRFEREKRAGANPQIVDYLPESLSADEREYLLRELILLEVELDTPNQSSAASLKQSYLTRFPTHETLINHVFESFDAEATVRYSAEDAGKAQDGSTLDQSIGDYELLEVLGRGGMGVVYKARHKMLERDVALKVTRSGSLASQEEVQRFLREARAAGQVNHPGVVPIHEVGEYGGQYFLAMGLVNGKNLMEHAGGEPLDQRRAAQICREICSAVTAIHAHGIIHRDLKPANILIDDKGTVYVTDFGLARLLKSDSMMTATGDVLGTPSYMSPEQADGKNSEIDARSDVYAIGAILYYLLTGRPPFKASTIPITLQQVLEKPPVSPAWLNPEINRDLVTICLKCLEKSPYDRYQNVVDLSDDLQAHLEGRPVSARPINAVVRMWRWMNRHPLPSTLVASLLLLVLSSVAAIGFRSQMLTNERLRKSAEELAVANQQVADTEKFFGDVQKVQNELSIREPGWTWRCRELIQSLDLTKPRQKSDRLLRDAAVASWCGFDLKPFTVLPVPGGRVPGEVKSAGCLAFSPDGSLLAFGELINGFGPSIAVYSCSDFATPPTILSWDSRLDSLIKAVFRKKKRSDGFRSVAISPDNRYLAAGTRFGKVIVFDLNETEQTPRVLEVQNGVEVSQVEFSCDGTFLYAVGKNTLIKEWKHFEALPELEGVGRF